MSKATDFFKSCVLFLLRLSVVALPATFLTLCTMDLAAREISPLPLRVFLYGGVFLAYGGPIVGAIFKTPDSLNACCFITYRMLIFAVPFSITCFCCLFDMIVSCAGKEEYISPLTPKALVNYLNGQIGDFSTALFVAALIKVAAVIVYSISICFGLKFNLQPSDLQKLLIRLKLSSLSGQEPTSLPSRAPIDSGNTRHEAPPKYEAIILMDQPPPSYEGLPKNTVVGV